MKKYLFLLLTGLSFSATQAQETTPGDALRLAVTPLSGTARFRAMSGAFGAVGGDFSAINVNPAGSIFFNTNQFSMTATVHGTKNDSDYFGTNTSQNCSRFDFNQIGTVFVYTNYDRNSDWKKFSFAINYDNTANFNNSTYSAGINPSNSIGNYFVNFAQGVPLQNLSNQSNYYTLGFNQQQAYLGYQTYIFDPKTSDPNNTQYTSNVPTGGNYAQQNWVYTSGNNGKIVTNFSTSYKNFISFGLNLNFHFVSINKDSSVYESNNNAAVGNAVSDIYFQNRLYTSGSGFSLNVGTIVKPTENIRLGLAYESPTWYDLTDQLTQGVTTHTANNPSGYGFYPYPIVYLPYTIQTPGKWTGSFAYIYQKKGLISFDVASKNYANTQFKPTSDPLFSSLNNTMSATLKNALEYRLGGEYRIQHVSLRGGYRFEQSPYVDTRNFGNLNGFSAGIGYSFGPSRLDFGYSHDQRSMSQYFVSSGMTDPAQIKSYRNDFTLTYCVNF